MLPRLGICAVQESSDYSREEAEIFAARQSWNMERVSWSYGYWIPIVWSDEKIFSIYESDRLEFKWQDLKESEVTLTKGYRSNRSVMVWELFAGTEWRIIRLNLVSNWTLNGLPFRLNIFTIDRSWLRNVFWANKLIILIGLRTILIWTLYKIYGG